jgi:hypothetical protein
MKTRDAQQRSYTGWFKGTCAIVIALAALSCASKQSSGNN